jgi:hypothetical protein
MIENKDIIGGVTPLKKRTQKFKAGDVGKKATRKNVELKTGFQRSGKEHLGGRNYESLTGNTRVTSSLADTLKIDPSSILGKNPGFGKIDDILNPERQVRWNEEERPLEDYKPYWDARIGDKSKWSPGMKSFLKNVDLSDPNAVKEAYDKWYKVSSKKENVEARKKNREARKGKHGYQEERFRKSPKHEWGPWTRVE